jgi:ATP adenylyltransferase
VRAERTWKRALERSAQAHAHGSLVPLSTERLSAPGLAPFVLRRLLSRTPKHLRAGGPKPNPFLPWETDLEVELLGDEHVLLLNKYPVQPGHLLLISRRWQPQAGWLSVADWRAVTTLAVDCGGLWFFNSCAAAGASQPHRHLQLLPRAAGDPSCPLADLLLRQLRAEGNTVSSSPWPWAYALDRRRDPHDPQELQRLYHHQARLLGLGDPQHDPQPRQPYNLLFDDDWLMTVLRRREHCAGFSLNALGFAGYLLATEESRLDWLEEHGPWELLRQVAAERGAGAEAEHAIP